MPATVTPNKRVRRFALYLILFILVITTLFFVFVNRIIEPILRNRIHTLIIQGSDSLYRYELGNLHANFFGGNVEVENLHIHVDSSRYQQLAQNHALPALTLQLDLKRGYIKGIGIIALLFEKKISIGEILSKDADIVLLRHIKEDDAPQNTQPLWKAIRPNIKSISIDRINLDGIKLLYKNADTSFAVKLQFDRCEALFEDIKIDSTSAADTSRIAFTKKISMLFNDLKFRTPDSSYKMKAKLITYSSQAQTLEVDSFKLQPTRETKESFYAEVGHQQGMNVIEFDNVRLTSFRLDRFVNNNIITADTVVINQPKVNIYSDKTQPPTLESKIGKYPHQLLLKASSTIMVKAITVKNGDLTYTEKGVKTAQEGSLNLHNMNIAITNVTNDSNLIKKNHLCTADMQANILGSSPMNVHFTFYLDSTNGSFDASGGIKNVSASQLNNIAEPLANVKIQSFDMHQLNFDLHGDNYSATTNLRMRYNNLFIVLQKTDDETGATKTKKFLTKLLNKFTLYNSNPAPETGERVATGATRVRISTQPFFGFVWQTIFTGMQNVMLKSGRYQ